MSNLRQEAAGSLELELQQVVVTCLTRVLGTRHRSSARVIHAFHSKPSLQGPPFSPERIAELPIQASDLRLSSQGAGTSQVHQGLL